MELWETSLMITKETEMKAWILSCQSEMVKFPSLFSCSLVGKIFKQTDNSGATSQTSGLFAAEGQEITADVLQWLQLYVHKEVLN